MNYAEWLKTVLHESAAAYVVDLASDAKGVAVDPDRHELLTSVPLP